MANQPFPKPNNPPETQIQQNLDGDRNQMIGQVLGGIVVYGQVIYNNAIAEPDTFLKSEDVKIGPNPYKGLLAFQETDGDRFFGRDQQIQELWEQFRSLHEDESKTRLLAIYGPSGFGKSSLARAGLIPELARRPLPRDDRDADPRQRLPGRYPRGMAAQHAAVSDRDRRSALPRGGIPTTSCARSRRTRPSSWRFHGPVRLVRAFLPMLEAAKQAQIVNISSVGSLIGVPVQTAYTASKFAIRGFSEALRHELVGSTVGVTPVNPGGVNARIVETAYLAGDQEATTKRVEDFQKNLKLSSVKAAEITADAKLIDLFQRLMPVSYFKVISALFSGFDT